jgi:hypothetical protein
MVPLGYGRRLMRFVPTGEVGMSLASREDS